MPNPCLPQYTGPPSRVVWVVGEKINGGRSLSSFRIVLNSRLLLDER